MASFCERRIDIKYALHAAVHIYMTVHQTSLELCWSLF